MGKFLNRFYERFSSDLFLDYVNGSNFVIDWVVEAGCHDGTDTELLFNLKGVKTVYAFEPDPIAYEKAKQKLNHLPDQSLKLLNLALSNIDEKLQIVEDEGGLGNGSTMVSQVDSNGHDYVEARKLDSVLKGINGHGLLWLDVEGHAVNVLKGAASTLKQIKVAKVEVQMHFMRVGREEDAFEVIKLMRGAGLRPVKVPLQPSFFGDITFLRGMNIRDLAKSFFLLGLFYILHKVLYPILKKPRPN